MPNETDSAPQKALLTDLKAARESLALDLSKAQKLDERAQLLRLTRNGDPAPVELQLAETIAEIRIQLGEVVARLEKDSGERWTLGLRASQFARELRNARAHLSVASVIWGRLGFVIDQIAAEPPNDGKEPAPVSAAA